MKQDNFLPEGTILRNGERDYIIKSVLGQGGFGITYLATAKVKAGNVWVKGQFAIKEHFDRKLNHRVGTTAAISNPSTESEIRDSIKSFMVESKRLSELQHRNIVPVNESFEANNTAYYVMQYIEGGNLTEMVKNAPDGRLPENLSISIIKQVADAIRYLHSMRMTHLDVKPDNVVMQDGNTPILIDFGLVKRYDKTGKPTTTNKAAGVSDGYAPLEQYAGLTEFTPEADVYALAATLLFMLTGKTPYKAGQMKAEIIESWLIDVASPRVIQAIIHAMAVQTEHRTHNVNQFLKELELGIIGPDDGNGKNGGTIKLPPKPRPTPWDKIIKIGCAAIAILFGSIFALFFMLSIIGSCEDGDNAVEISDTIKSDSIVIDSPVKKDDEGNPSKPVGERVQATENKKPEVRPSSPDANNDKTDVIELANPDASQMARTYMGKFESGERTSENLSKAFEYALKADEETKAEIINKLKEVGYRPALQY